MTTPLSDSTNTLKSDANQQDKLAQKYQDDVKRFCSDADAHLNGNKLATALKTSLLHFEKHSNSTNLVADIFHVFMVNSARGVADKIKVIVKDGFAISLTWKKAEGKVDHKVHKPSKRNLDTDVRDMIMKELDVGHGGRGLDYIYQQLTKNDSKPAKSLSFQEKLDKIYKGFEREIKKFEDLGSVPLDESSQRALMYKAREIKRELESRIDALEQAQLNLASALLDNNATPEESPAEAA